MPEQIFVRQRYYDTAETILKTLETQHQNNRPLVSPHSITLLAIRLSAFFPKGQNFNCPFRITQVHNPDAFSCSWHSPDRSKTNASPKPVRHRFGY